MAVVYAGWHEQLERRVALKVLAAHLAGDEAFRTRFLREARIAARLTTRTSSAPTTSPSSTGCRASSWSCFRAERSRAGG